MEEAINTVCMASLKLAAFYGLWTWFIHTVFQVNFVVIPAGELYKDPYRNSTLLENVQRILKFWKVFNLKFDIFEES